MTDLQKSIIIGSLLGDGSLEKGCKSSCFREQHTEPQKEYLEWKYLILKDLCNHGNTVSLRDFGKVYRLSTAVSEEFTKMRRRFYPNGKKIIPNDLMQDFNELVLTVWYLDDGDHMTMNGTQLNTARISSMGFRYKENLYLRRILHKKFGIQTTLYKESGKYYRLYFPSRNGAHDKLMGIIKDCFEKYGIPDYMKYKLIERVETKQGRAPIAKKGLSQDKFGRFVAQDIVQK